MVSKKHIVALFAVLLILSATLLMITSSSLLSAHIFSEIRDNSDINHSGDCFLYDEYDSDTSSISSFFSDPNSLQIMKDTYILLNKSQRLNYYEFGYQNIEYQGKADFPSKFVDNNDNDLINQKTSSGGYFTPLKSFQINDKLIKRESLTNKLFDGEMISEAIQSNTIPIVVGYDYYDYFPLGKTFYGDYLGKIYQYKVIGILKKGAIMSINNESVLLDTYIVSPTIIPFSNDDLSFQKRLYSVKCEGFFNYKSIEEYTSALNEIKHIRNSTSFKYYIPDQKSRPHSLLPEKESLWLLAVLCSLLLYVLVNILLIWAIKRKNLPITLTKSLLLIPLVLAISFFITKLFLMFNGYEFGGQSLILAWCIITEILYYLCLRKKKQWYE